MDGTAPDEPSMLQLPPAPTSILLPQLPPIRELPPAPTSASGSNRRERKGCKGIIYGFSLQSMGYSLSETGPGCVTCFFDAGRCADQGADASSLSPRLAAGGRSRQQPPASACMLAPTASGHCCEEQSTTRPETTGLQGSELRIGHQQGLFMYPLSLSVQHDVASMLL